MTMKTRTVFGLLMLFALATVVVPEGCSRGDNLETNTPIDSESGPIDISLVEPVE